MLSIAEHLAEEIVVIVGDGGALFVNVGKNSVLILSHILVVVVRRLGGIIPDGVSAAVAGSHGTP